MKLLSVVEISALLQASRVGKCTEGYHNAQGMVCYTNDGNNAWCDQTVRRVESAATARMRVLPKPWKG